MALSDRSRTSPSGPSSERAHGASAPFAGVPPVSRFERARRGAGSEALPTGGRCGSLPAGDLPVRRALASGSTMSIELPTQIADAAWPGRHVVRRIVRHIDGRIDKPIHGRTAERRQTASVGRRGRRSTISLRAVAAAVVAAIAVNRARRRRASFAEAVRSIVAEYRRRLRSSAVRCRARPAHSPRAVRRGRPKSRIAGKRSAARS
ncbi:hypothetical protein GBP346_B1341 [Burkholderia pseudomallei MSHR346]|nr:hypothetical protein GBP346_B1341 [Burkholderia pseudomallei MSHR346]